MGRTVIGEEAIEAHISTLYTKDKWIVGLILGQITEQKDYAVHLAPTPKDDSTEEAGGQGDKKIESIEDLSESWVSIHTRQVLRMLPGGLDILGIFCVANPDVMKGAQAKLRQLLFAVHNTANPTEGNTLASTDRIVLQLCSLTRKLTCRTFDVSDKKSAAKPAEWKYQKYLERWHTLETAVAVDHVIPIINAAMSQSLEKQLLRGVQPICDNIWNSVALINGELAQNDRLLNPSQPTGKKAKRTQEESTGLLYNVDFLCQQPRIQHDSISSPTITPCGAKLVIQGTMCCRAFVHGKATVAEAVKALRNDIVRSLTSRCELLCEDLLQAEEEQDRKVLYETPIRVFCPLRESSIQLCDYMFQDETNNDVVDRLKELIDLTVPEDTLETDCEQIPDEDDLCKTDKLDDTIPCSTGTQSNEKKSTRMILLLLCLIAAMFSVLIAFNNSS